MVAPAIRAPSVQVPGLLGDDALQEQLKALAQQQTTDARAVAPTSAVEMSQKIAQDFVVDPIKRTTSDMPRPSAAPVTPPAAAPEQPSMSSVLGRAALDFVSPLGGMLAEGGVLGRLGALTPEDAAAEQEQRVEAAEQEEQALKAAEGARQTLRDMTDEQAASMGLPVAPGVFDAETVRELDAQNERRRAFAAERAGEAAADTQMQRENAPTQTWWLNAARSAYKGTTGIASSAARGAVIPFEFTIGDGERSEVRAWVDKVDAAIEQMIPGDKAKSKDFLTKLSADGGSMLGFMIGGMASTSIGLPATAGTLIMGALTGGAEQYTDAERFDAGGVQKLMSYFLGMGIGATEAIPINNALMRLETGTGGVVSRMLQNTAASSMEEFVQELGQSIGSDLVAQTIYDENREIDWGEAFESAAIGGILGAMMGGSVSTLQEVGVLAGDPTAPVEAEAVQVDDAAREVAVDEFLTAEQATFDSYVVDFAKEVDAAELVMPELAAAVAPDQAAAVAPDQAVAVEPEAATPSPVEVADALVARAATEVRPSTVVAEEFVAALPRAPLFEFETAQARGGTVPAPGPDGKVTLRHYAAEPRAVLDPEFQGTGPLRGEERARLAGGAVPRVYYGVNTGADFRPAAQPREQFAKLNADERAAARRLVDEGVLLNEGQVRVALEARWSQEMRRSGYQREAGLGDIEHEVKVDPDDLYNMAEDPLGLRTQLDPNLTPAERTTQYEQLVRDAGFRGAFFPESTLGQTAILFEAAEPTSVIDTVYGVPPEDIARIEDFANLTAETFNKGGWAIVTGTREALGPATAPENVAANERMRKRLERDKVPYIEVSGAYMGEAQGEVFLILAPPEYARKLGRSYKQESILTRRGLEYTDGSDRLVPHVPTQTVVGDAARELDFYSTMPDGTSFSMGLDFDALVDPAAEAATAVTGDQWTPQELAQTLTGWAEALSNPESTHPLAAEIRELAENAGDLDANQLAEVLAGQLAAGRAAATGEGTAAAERAGDGPWVLAALREQDAEPTSGAQGGGEVLAQTAQNRGSYRGEPQRPAQGIPGAPDAANAEIRLAKIADNFTKLLDLTIRQGRFTLRGGNVMGQYSSRQDVVRLRTPNDLSTLIHEGGHALQARATGPLKTFINGHVKELQKVAKALYGGDLSKADSATKTAEGFAEFFRIYVTNRAFAERKYPKLSNDFAAVLDGDPRLRDGLKSIGDQFAAWLQLPSAQLLRNMVVSGERVGPINEALAEIESQGFGTWMHEVARNALAKTVNQNAALNDIVAGVLNVAQDSGRVLDLKAAEDPRVLIRLTANSGGRAMVQVTDGVMGHRSTVPTSRSLRDALLKYHGLEADQNLSQIDPERQADFAAYLIALRGIDEYRRFSEGKIERPPVAATLGDLKVAVQELNAKYGSDFAEAAQMVHEYGMALWQKAFDAGLMSKDTYKDGLDRQFYAPLQRDMSDRGPSMSDIAGTTAARPVKRFRGSDRDIIDPMDALMAKTFALERVIAENEVKKSLASLADKVDQVGSLVHRVPAQQMLGQEYSVQEVARQLTKDDTLTEADAQDLMTLLEASIEEGNRVALFRSQQALARGENIVFFWENGKLAALQIKDGSVGADVVNTLNAVGVENMPLLVDTLAHTSTAFRSAIISWPDFLVVNFIRDQVSAWLLTDVGYKPFVSGFGGMIDEVRQKTWARQYNAAMGIMGGMNTAALHKARVDRDISSLRNRGYLVQAFGAQGMGRAIKGIARITELSETGTRLGIFKNAYERAKADGLTDWEASIEASYIATDYIDFGLHGNRMLAHRRLIPFLNAQLQGLYKMMRTLGGDEVRQRRGLMFALTSFFKDINGLELSRREKAAIRTGRKAWLKMMSLGLIGALLHFIFEDDPDYQDTSEYLRATGWVIPLGEGRIAYVPKPFELAIVSNFVERALEHASGDGEAKARFLRGAMLNLTPPTSPPAVQVLVEQLANYDFFSDRDIVPDYMQALAPELQYSHFTSTFAKQVGSWMGWSPLRVDHAMSGLFASAYRDAIQAYNSTDPNRPNSDATEWPLTRRFVRDARRGATSSQDFWTYASTVSGTLRRAETTYRRYLDEGREQTANAYLDTLDEDHKSYALLNAHFKAEAKRLNPMYRARQITTIVSGMRRELPTELGLEDTGPAGGEIVLSSREKAEVDEVLSEIARREVRNTLVASKAPGWANKKPLPVEPTLELLRAVHPLVAEEYERRYKKAKIYESDFVQEYWPEVKDRLIQDREAAFLDDIVTIAKAMQ